MKPIVLVYKPLYDQALQLIEESCQVLYFPEYSKRDPLFLDALSRAGGLIGSGLKIDKALLDKAPNLKMVANKSVGYDNLDIDLLKSRGIQASNTPGVLNDTVADTIMALMLAAARRVTELDRFVKTGEWAKRGFEESQFGLDVHHKTLGIIGMGGIGSTVARRARFGFNMNILYHNRSRNKQAEQICGAVYCSLQEVLKQSDFICLMTPLTQETKGMIGQKEFAQMKNTAIFINASRGAVLDEAALIEALDSHKIWGAGLDVFAREPVLPENPLLHMPNVVTLPHIGSATKETRLKMAMLAAENVVAGVTGQKLKTPIF